MSSDRARAFRMLSAVGIAFLMVWSSVSVFSAAPPESRDVYLVGLNDEDSPEVFRTIGVEVLVDYDNGMYLVEAVESQAIAMRRHNVDAVQMKNWRLLDLYPYDTPIDTSMGSPAPPSVMKGLGWDRETYIVQFIGPYKPEWLDSIEYLGGRKGKLVPSFSTVVKMSPDVKARVVNLPFVHWVGPYQPWYKLSSELLNTEGGFRVAIMAFDDSQKETLSERLVELGASVMMTYSPGTIVAYLDSHILPWVASIPEVMHVYGDYPAKPTDLMGAEIHGAFESWYPTRSGLPSSLTGQSPGPDGIEGTADDIFEVVGIQDSGFDIGNPDEGHPDFFMGPIGDRVIRYEDRTGRSDPDGFFGGSAHGTHLAGSVLGNGFAWEHEYGYPTDDDDWEFSEGVGIAPEAKLSFDGVQGLGGLSPNPSYWDIQYDDGAHVNLIGFSRPPSDYTGFAWTADMRADQNNDRLFVFAASNEGPDYNTLGGDALSKNGMTAGATLNFRPERPEAYNPNQVADFSGRGGPSQAYGRVKPDLVAVGTESISTMGVGEWRHYGGIPSFLRHYCIMEVDVYNYTDPPALNGDGVCDYKHMSGTSVSAAHMSGLAMLVREYLREYAGYTNAYAINSQLVKALMINGAVRMDEALYDYPGYDQGWGRADLMQSLFPPVPRTNRWEEGTMSAPGSWNPSFGTSVQSDEVPLKVTLTWVDSMGKDLFRDLDLIVTSPSGDTYVGNVYGTVGQSDGWSIPNPGVTDSNPVWDRDGNTYDDLNNVEQVEVQFPEVGAWQIQVVGRSIPSSAPFALVASADFGPQTEFRIELDTNYSLLPEVAPGGEVLFPFEVRNFGTSLDDAFLTPQSPAGIRIAFEKTLLSSMKPRETVSTYALIAVEDSVPSGAYSLKITAISLGDTNVTDQLELTLVVRCYRVPTPIKITNSTSDEMNPSVLTFNDGIEDHIFIAYVKTKVVDPGGRHGGRNVWVAHTTLDAQGQPLLPFIHMEVSDWNDNPNDIRWTHIPKGSYQNRIILTWRGDDPDAVNRDLDSYGVLSYSDPPYNTWNRVVIERNAGSSMMNEARLNIPLWRDDGTAAGEVIWVWEHLDYISPDASNPMRVQTWVAISRDGGETFPICDGSHPDCRRISPFDNNYYFFPTACIDTRNVLWVFFYYRVPAGDDRDLMVRLYDGNWQGDETPIISNDDVSLLWNSLNTNLQWPACVVSSEGTPNNRVYVVVTNDEGTFDLKLYVSYLEGHYNSTNRPFGLNVTEDQGISPNLHGPFGPFGNSASNSNNYIRPILNMVHTGDGRTWIQYIEKANEYGAPNLWAYSSIDDFTSSELSILTGDSYPKGHQMTDELTVNSTHHNVYEVYHMTKGTWREVNFDVYLLVYHEGWKNDPDSIGPTVYPIAAFPNPYDVSIGRKDLKVLATVSDTLTGYSNISVAEWKEVPLNITDPRMIDWTGALPMTIETDSPAETGLATFNPSTWDGGERHRLCARGQDEYNNWGIGACVDVITIGRRPIITDFNYTFVKKGWLSISVPLTLSDDSIAAVFSSIDGMYDQLRVYDEDTGRWLTYHKDKPWQTLDTVDKTMGIWINITTAPATLHVTGNLTYMTETILRPGWNFVGYPSLNSTGITVGDLLQDQYLNIDAVEGYDESNPQYLLRRLDASYYLQPGEGYWLYVADSESKVWSVPGF